MTAVWPVLAVVIAGQVAYHLLVRSAPPTVSPLLFVAIAYVAGSALLLLAGGSASISGIAAMRRLDFLRAGGLGLAVATIEVGYIYAYRSSLQLGLGPLVVLGGTTLILVLLSVAMFGEPFHWNLVAGGALVISGLAVLSSK